VAGVLVVDAGIRPSMTVTVMTVTVMTVTVMTVTVMTVTVMTVISGMCRGRISLGPQYRLDRVLSVDVRHGHLASPLVHSIVPGRGSIDAILVEPHSYSASRVSISVISPS
jgi:hypothetical protein